MRNELVDSLREAILQCGIEAADIHLEHPTELLNGDYSTNVAMVCGPKTGKKPLEFAKELARKLNERKDERIEKIEVAGPGFINFYVSGKFLAREVQNITEAGDAYGKNETRKGEKIMVEYTDPNPFKEFHIGHLMSNAIGESLARLFEFTGAKIVRANWQGDVGPHVAKAIWGKMQKSEVNWGEAYAYGVSQYDGHKEEIDAINKKIYDKSDSTINTLYNLGRKESLDHFEKIYKVLGTSFDYYFFEGVEGLLGIPIVHEFLDKGVFEKSDGAVIFRGEEYGLHTRVFLTAQGLPTYEAKELGLNKVKFDNEKDIDESVIVTANEQKEYLRVVLKAMEFIFPTIAEKTKHITHGMMRLPTGKMSSRTGDVITAEMLLNEAKQKIVPKVQENEERSLQNHDTLVEEIAVGAIKYSILKQATGRDIIFDFNTSLSFEGNSGPYLQYTHARACSILRKAKEAHIQSGVDGAVDDIGDVERLVHRFPEIVDRAQKEYEPHYVATYLFELAQAFNNFYARERIIESGDLAPYRVALTEAVSVVIKNGLYLLGIKSPERM